ncbi:uncharacterized protein [Cherax quadricarinatus]|uniref:uncharacterized protein n=1 Tax=Cherax quadricarinatus TaxID=27406 RepID=UPI002377D83F|nr:uncharacterized protein LOC128692001 [Cherax quadricarinatus]
MNPVTPEVSQERVLRVSKQILAMFCPRMKVPFVVYIGGRPLTTSHQHTRLPATALVPLKFWSTNKVMKLIGLIVGVWACILVSYIEVEASPCCGVGVVAVGALAFTGGVIAGRHHQRHHHHHHHIHECLSCGCGGCGGACGWCGGNYYGRRRRRSISAFIEDAEIQQAYKKVAVEDKDQCGLRVVCELAQKDPRELAEDEIQILLPYRGAGESDGTTYGNYDEAAWHGQEGHSCPSNYPLCAFTADQVMTEYRKYIKNNGTFAVTSAL